MPDPTTDPIGSYWVNGSGGATAISATDLNARETVAAASLVLPFSRPGTLAISKGTAKFRMPINAKLLNVVATVGMAPTGNPVKVDVNRNGFTVFTTQANRPSITANTIVSGVATPDVTAFAAGDFLSVDIDEIGTTLAGTDLTVTLSFQGATSGPTFGYADAIGVTPNLVSYWRLGDGGATAIDSFGAHNGSYVASPPTSATLVTGGDSARDFNGSTQYVAITGSNVLHLTSFTFEAWIKSDTNPTSAVIMDIGGGGYATFFFSNPALTGGTTKLIGTIWNGTTNSQVTGTTTIVATTRYHAALTWDNATKDFKIFINGVQDATTNLSGVSVIYDVAFASAIGAGAAGTGVFFDGKIDEAAVYDAALPSAVLLAHYNKGA